MSASHALQTYLAVCGLLDGPLMPVPLPSVAVQHLRILLVEILDKPAVVDLPQEVHVPQRQRVDFRSVAVLLVLLQGFLIDVVYSRQAWIELGLQARGKVVIDL